MLSSISRSRRYRLNTCTCAISKVEYVSADGLHPHDPISLAQEVDLLMLCFDKYYPPLHVPYQASA